MATAIHEELNKRSVPVRRVDGCRGTGIHLQTIMSQVLGKSEADVDADDVERLFYAMTERETPNERLALIIDDAERLLPDALAYLRLLVSIAPEHMPQIIFIGDPSFWDIADRVTEAGFKDLIAAHFVLELLNPTEMFEAAKQFISVLCHVPRPVLDQGALEAVVQRSNGLVGPLVSLIAAIDALATESDQTQVTAAVVDAAAARLEGEAASRVTTDSVPWLELGVKPAPAHDVPTLVPELNTQRPDRSIVRITSAAAVVVTVGAISAATYWLVPLDIDRIWTELRTAVGHRDSAEAAAPVSPDATTQVRLPFSASALQAQPDAPDSDSASAFPVIPFVPRPGIIKPSVLAAPIRSGADKTVRSRERPGDYVSPSPKGIWLFPPNANGGG
jgi:hypothetical protein